MNKSSIYKLIISVFLIILISAFFWAKFHQVPAPVTKQAKIPKVTRAYIAKIAFVIDDLGYNSNNLPIVEDIKYPMTFSVLPRLAYSEKLVKVLKRRGFEIILHLPMEPYEKVNLEENTILTSMDQAKIKEIITGDLSSVSFARGVSNHMGSRVTENLGAMNAIFNELKNSKLYFLDSFVTGKSLGRDLARQTGVKFARRDVFLDNVLDKAYIRKQISQLKSKAKKNGAAIGIGHDRKVTLETLKEEMPEMDKEGYKFVFVSDLVR